MHIITVNATIPFVLAVNGLPWTSSSSNTGQLATHSRSSATEIYPRDLSEQKSTERTFKHQTWLLARFNVFRDGNGWHWLLVLANTLSLLSAIAGPLSSSWLAPTSSSSSTFPNSTACPFECRTRSPNRLESDESGDINVGWFMLGIFLYKASCIGVFFELCGCIASVLFTGLLSAAWPSSFSSGTATIWFPSRSNDFKLQDKCRWVMTPLLYVHRNDDLLKFLMVAPGSKSRWGNLNLPRQLDGRTDKLWLIVNCSAEFKKTGVERPSCGRKPMLQEGQGWNSLQSWQYKVTLQTTRFKHYS